MTDNIHEWTETMNFPGVHFACLWVTGSVNPRATFDGDGKIRADGSEIGRYIVHRQNNVDVFIDRSDFDIDPNW